ncbi:hypothetical protein CHS0354_028647 [Potamilus streckersoni]|uniref:Uncharacterized protein n=1 Tax=Potamilus streckersoni TaxID=2493646 RepID=A0AAE0SWM9_9BIVA|nr:hypothetical protein CHS0354_028647 [Potamilus streckersoni]
MKSKICIAVVINFTYKPNVDDVSGKLDEIQQRRDGRYTLPSEYRFVKDLQEYMTESNMDVKALLRLARAIEIVRTLIGDEICLRSRVDNILHVKLIKPVRIKTLVMAIST